MNITNNTMYNKDLIIKYNKYYGQAYMIKNFVIITLVSLAFIIYMVIEKQWAYAGLLLGILVIYYILTLGMQKLTTARMLKRSSLVENPILQTYVFTDIDILVTNVKSYTITYDQIVKAIKAKDFYILNTNDRKTYIIDYNGFQSNDDLIELEQFFIENLNMKVSKKKK